MHKTAIYRSLPGVLLMLVFGLMGNGAFGADVLVFLLGKGRNFVQTSTTDVHPPATGPVGAAAHVYLTSAGAGTTALIAGSPPAPLSLVEPFHLMASQDFSSQAALDAGLPNGTYTLQMFTINDGLINANLTLAGNTYPNAPRITNYDAAQAINPHAPFTLMWATFTGGTASDFIYFEIREFPGGTGSQIVVRILFPNQAGALRGTATQVTIPAGMLALNKTYALEMLHVKVTDVETMAYPATAGYAGYAAITRTTVATVGTIIPPTITHSPTNVAVGAGGIATFTVGAAGTGPFSYEWRRNNNPVPGATASTLRITNVQPAHAGEYRLLVSNSAGSALSEPATLSILPETIKPTVAISTPPANARLTNSIVVARGTAADNLGVTLVEYRLENVAGVGSYTPATGTNSWTAEISNLLPGTNTIRVRAHDENGNISAEVTRTFTYVLMVPLALTINGNGSVVPHLNGRLLEAGKRYSVTAKPATGHLFSHWSGSVATNTAVLSFTMQNGLTLQANFIPNPFIPVKGVYTGLFSEPGEVKHNSSGLFTLTLRDSGKFSARAQSGAKRTSFSGQFNLDGRASNVVTRVGESPLAIIMDLSLSGDETITGEITDGTWTAELLADRSVFSAATNPAPQLGKYTLIIPGGDDPASSPAGDGFAIVAVTTAGQMQVNGTLADGTRFSQRAPLSKAGQAPLYAALYTGNGSAVGWLNFIDGTSEDLNGQITWTKPATAVARLYPAGFAVQTAATGSRYVAPSGNRVLNFDDGVAAFSHGNLPTDFTNRVMLGADNKVANLSSNKLTLAIVLPTGQFTGTVVDPTSGRSIPFKGALLQKQNLGAGFFVGTNQSGRVYFGP